MSQKLYHQNGYLAAFSSRVTQVQSNAVCLEATAFYPGGGGQLCDTGSLNGFRVLETSKKDGKIWHWLESAVELPEVLTGQLDWSRRFDHMQQHTGEHLLGQAFFRLSRDVIAVNMEHSVCTLDLAQSTDWATALSAEQIANDAVLAALPIQTYEIPDSEIASLPFRRVPKVSGQIRVVQIGNFDYSACAGTHTSRSSEVGLIKIFKLERIKSGATRVYFNCGVRLLEDYRLKHDFVAALALRFSSGIENVPTRTLAALEELGTAKLEIIQLRSQLAARIASGFLRGVVVHRLEDVSLLAELAKVCTARDNLIAILGASDDSRAYLTVTCGRAITAQAREILALGLPLIDGKGGGKKDLAQGSGANIAGLEAALEAMRLAVGYLS